MAITAIWDIKDSLKRVINYAANKRIKQRLKMMIL